MAKKKNFRKSRSTPGSSVSCNEAMPPPPPPPPPFADEPYPEMEEESAQEQYDEAPPAAYEEPSPPESTSEPAESSQEVLEQAWISPYTKTPVSIHFGDEGTAYLVPPHLLPSAWLDSGVWDRFEFPGIDAHTGHTIVHYLYTDSYEIPPANTSVTGQKHNDLRAALLVFVATCNHDLHDLRHLAIENIAKHGGRLTLTELLEVIDDDFPRLRPHSWVHDYLCYRAKKAFDKDHTVFSDKSFLQNLGSPGLVKFMASCVVDLYSNKLTQMTDTKQSSRQSKSPEDVDKEDPSQVGDEPNVAQVSSHISSAASETSVEQSCEPRDEALTLSDSFSTISCPHPEDLLCEVGPVAEDIQGIPEQIAVSAVPEVYEILDEPWPDSCNATVEEHVVIPDSPCMVEEADECVPATQELPAPLSRALTEDIPAVISPDEEQMYPSSCPLQAQHMLMGYEWKRCSQCLEAVRRLADQIP